MSKKRILIVVGTRPNFIKVTQFKKLVSGFPELDVRLVHTGQHSDKKMADVFFKQFHLKPDYLLNISSGSPNSQIAEIMLNLEKLIKKFKPDLILVVGDVNSTLAGALTANKMSIPLAHLESGLRSFDDTMPEEYNRVIADRLSQLYFVTEQSGLDNLIREGVHPEKIHFVGNTMIDTMVAFEKEIKQSSILKKLKIENQKFVLMTMHRPATVDNKTEFSKLISLIDFITKSNKIIFPIHPRTLKNAEKFGLLDQITENKNLICTEPLDYFSFQKLIKKCTFIITDSGGIQEESTFRKKPCLTLRPNTERPGTVSMGTNTLLPFSLTLVKKYIRQIENGSYKKGRIPPYWDGKSTLRILKILQGL